MMATTIGERHLIAQILSLRAARERARFAGDGTTAMALGMQLRMLIERQRGRQAARRRLASRTILST